MKKILKGCFIAIISLIGVIFLFGIGIYFYSKTPNKIVVCKSPILFKDVKEDIDFPIGEIPSYIRNVDSKNIVYQASWNSYDWVNHCVYICVLRPNGKFLSLKNKLPIKNEDLIEINRILLSSKLTNPYTPKIDLPDNMETEPGLRVKVYNPKLQEKLNLKFRFISIYEILRNRQRRVLYRGNHL
jgi:hypothetical protein